MVSNEYIEAMRHTSTGQGKHSSNPHGTLQALHFKMNETQKSSVYSMAAENTKNGSDVLTFYCSLAVKHEDILESLVLHHGYTRGHLFINSPSISNLSRSGLR